MARHPALGDRPPAYPDKTALAAELCISETTVDDWTRHGILPKPRRLRGSVRWRWVEVDAKLTPPPGSPMTPPAGAAVSPFMEAIRDVP